MGNLLIVSLWELLGDTVEGLDLVGRLLGARGPGAADGGRAAARSRPTWSTARPGRRDGSSGRAPSRWHAPATIAQVRLEPGRPARVPGGGGGHRAADWVVLGPGSWYTSVLPHLLVPGPARRAAPDERRSDPDAEPRVG